MMVAYNEVNAYFLCISNQVGRFNSTIEGNNEGEIIFPGKINPSLAHTIPFPVAMGNIKINIGIDFFQELVHAGDSSCSVHIIVTEYKDLFFVIDGGQYPGYSFIHVFHQPGIMQISKRRAKKIPGSIICFDATFNKYLANDRMYLQ